MSMGLLHIGIYILIYVHINVNSYQLYRVSKEVCTHSLKTSLGIEIYLTYRPTMHILGAWIC